ncbi:hypothetical protein SZ64_07135 [Erythrobacter sp. SG61-1L]|uniref:hypothetical protein n=1 Tax=Erythrobacter sp. SG61-1L TaxID=1603897 RepID=UPI0006D6A8A9|nr:hypothetical protein [Erythrobacter sp. SG61-1L]KPL67911.1 hypothetical protein SZ64_07135 [Erythrobacter sp. SG61-1L]
MSRMKIAGLSLGLAATLALSAQPAMAAPQTRSAASLPSRPYVSTQSFGSVGRQPAVIGGNQGRQGSGLFGGGMGNGFGGGGFFPLPLPQRLIDRLENFFLRAGIDNPGLCRVFDFSFCDDNDSPG